MKNQLGSNRVEMELNRWKNREDRFSKLFSFDLSNNKALLRAKLHFYEGIASKYRQTRDPDERFALQVLKQDRRRMERQLYPNLLLRLLRRLIVLPVRKQVVRRRDFQQVELNSRSLQDQIRKAGFSGLSAKLDEQIRVGQSQFTIPVSYYMNENGRMDHQLIFTRDHSGQYQFQGFEARLTDEREQSPAKQHYFNAEDGVDLNKAYHLLDGRPIEKIDRWIQFDLNDKDDQGNYRVKEFLSSYGFNLEKVLQDLPIKELQDRNTAHQLLDKMKQGSREAVSFLKDGKEQKYFIEANPQFKVVNIYDEHSKKISLSTALGITTTDAVKITHKENEKQVQVKKNGMKVHH